MSSIVCRLIIRYNDKLNQATSFWQLNVTMVGVLPPFEVQMIGMEAQMLEDGLARSLEMPDHTLDTIVNLVHCSPQIKTHPLPSIWRLILCLCSIVPSRCRFFSDRNGTSSRSAPRGDNPRNHWHRILVHPARAADLLQLSLERHRRLAWNDDAPVGGFRSPFRRIRGCAEICCPLANPAADFLHLESCVLGADSKIL